MFQNHSVNIKKYHLIAGAPKTESAMQHCCSTFVGDIVTQCLDESNSKVLIVSRKYHQLALRRGMCFELKYVPVIINSSLRKDILAMAYMYASQRKAKNVIISSGAMNKFQIRGPYDIANLYVVFF